MKKQYDIYETRSWKYDIVLYHDGVKIFTESKWQGNELDNYINEIESEGYERGYLKEDVEAAKRHYEYLLARQIGD